MTPQVVIYIRQAVADEDRFQQHLIRCHEYARSAGWTVVGEYSDVGMSGNLGISDTQRGVIRPGLHDVIRLAANREIGVLITPSPHHIARNREVFYAVVTHLGDLSVEVVFLEEVRS